MRYNGNGEQEVEEMSDAFETGLQGSGTFETETESFDPEASDSESFDTESFDPEASDSEFDTESFDSEFTDFEQENEAGRGGAARRGAGGRGVQQKLQQQRAALGQLKHAVQSIGKHIRRDGTRLRFTLPVRTARDASMRLRVRPEIVSALLKSMQKTNQRPAPPSREQETELDEVTMWQEVSGACPGETKVTRHWWGLALWLNECHTKTVVEAAGAGGGAAALCAAVAPHPAAKGVCAIAGAVIAIGAGAIKAIDAWGGNKGIVIRKPWVTPPGIPPIVIWHQ